MMSEVVISSKERIEALLSHLKKSRNAVGVSIGDKNGMRFQHVLNGRNEVSEKLASDITRVYPEISYVWLLNGNGPMLEPKEKPWTKTDTEDLLTRVNDFKPRPEQIVVSEPLEQITNKTGNVFEELPNGKYRLWTKKLPVKAFASYLSDFRNASFMEELQDVSWTVDHIARGRYMTIEAEGDSMNGGGLYDAPDGAELLGRELLRHHWKDGFKESKRGWVIVHRETMVYKDIIDFNRETGDIVCHSRSGLPQHPDFTINLDDVLEIWKILKASF